MPVAKKVKDKEKKPKAKNIEEDSDDEDSGKEEEEEVESEHARRKREKGRTAFMRLLRQLFSLIPLAMVLSQQPFMVKPRAPGVNRGKVVPLQLAVCGVLHWAKSSPTTLRNRQLASGINSTARALLTPYEYWKVRESKRAMPAEKTISGAYKKTEKALQRVGDMTDLREIALMPQPNIPLIGAYVLTAGALFAPMLPGMEYLVIVGSGAVLQGCRGFQMEPQPELYVTGVVAVLGCFFMDAAGKKKEEKKRKRR